MRLKLIMRKLQMLVCACVCVRVTEAGCWPLSRRRQDSVLVQTLVEEGVESTAVRNRNWGRLALLGFTICMLTAVRIIT